MIVLGIAIICYWVDIFLPFLDQRREVKSKIKSAETYEKHRYYTKKYRRMKLEVLPVVGGIFRKAHKRRRRRRHSSRR